MIARPTVAVVQARMGSSRLPGKVLERLGDRAVVLWAVAAMRAVPGVDEVVLATTSDAADDALAALASQACPVHRGSRDDVLTRIRDAAAPFAPGVVVRATADNPFVDPDVVARQIGRLRDADLDYVGNESWPLGTAAEAVRWDVLETAVREATDPAEREHVTPFIWTRPERFRVGGLPAGHDHRAHQRYTIDSDEDLAFCRAVVQRLGHGPPVRLAELEDLLGREPHLGKLNRSVAQRSWRERSSEG